MTPALHESDSRARSLRSVRSSSGPLPLYLVLPGVVAAAVALTPFVYLFVRAGQAAWQDVERVLLRPRLLELLGNTLLLAAVVTTLCVVVGVSLAWLVVRSDLPGRRLLGTMSALPLAIPTYVAAYAWLSLVPEISGFLGAATVLTLSSFPYVFIPVAAALHGADPAMEEASRALGAGPWATFWRVTVRSMRPSIAAGALLVVLYVLSDFGAVSLMRYETFTFAIFQSYQAAFDRTAAVVLALVLAGVTLVIVWGEARTRGRARYARLGAGVARQGRAHGLGRLRIPAACYASGVAALALGIPATALAYWLVRGRSQMPPLSEISAAAVSSVGLSLGGAAVTVALATPVGLLVARYGDRLLPRLLERATYVGHALPGIVVALSLVFLSVRVFYGLYQTALLVILAYAVLFLPLAVGAVRSSAAQAPPALEDVARSLGRGPFEVLRTITLPLVTPGIAAGAALVFLTCMKELPATLLLRPTGVDTLATELWTETGVGAFAAAAPYAALLVLLSAVPTYLVSRRTGGWLRAAEMSARADEAA